jgi:tellurite resistance protein
MSMRVDEIQGLVTVLQHRRTLHVQKQKQILGNSRIAIQKRLDDDLQKALNKLEKIIERMKKDDAAVTTLLNSARGLVLEASDGTLVLEKTNGLTQGTRHSSEATE